MVEIISMYYITLWRVEVMVYKSEAGHLYILGRLLEITLLLVHISASAHSLWLPLLWLPFFSMNLTPGLKGPVNWDT